MNMSKLICSMGLPILLLFSTLSHAQSKVIKGRVTDPAGNGIPGVSVTVKGETRGTTTATDGSYSLNVPAEATTLVFSSVGYGMREVSINTSGTINASLQTTANNLNEVVVVGYGTRMRKDLTGSVASVTSKDFQQGIITTPENLIAGKVAGVVVTPNNGQPGSGATIRIRGTSSVNASNSPLIVIDGVPLDLNTNTSGIADPLSLINPNDIESFNILKDASAAAIYGNRASNGVIIITTKKGTSGRLRVGFSTVNSIAKITKEVPVLTADQFRNFVKAHDIASGRKDSTLLGTANTNWQDQIYHAAFSTDNNISVTGGVKGLPYRLSAGYLHQDGILKTDKLQRTSLSFNLSPTFLNNTLHIDANVKGSVSKVRFANQSAIGTATSFDPTQPVYSASSPYGGYYEWVSGSIPSPNAPRNPLGLLMQKNDNSTVQRSIGNIQFDYKIPFLEGLRANLNAGYDLSKSSGSIFIPATAASNFTTNGSSYNYSQFKRNELIDFYLNYAKSFGKSRLDATAGYGYQDFYYENPGYNYYTAAGVLQSSTAPALPSASQHTLLSFYGRLNYTYNDRYLLSASLRRDGSSRFSPSNRWGTFPSVALGWRISQEDFLRNSSTFSDLKLRVGYGKTGQQDIGYDYPYLPVYTIGSSTVRYPFGDSSYYTYRPSAYDINIKWETTTAYNAGLDFGFLKGRLSGSIDLYYKKTENLLLYTAVPGGANLSNYLTTNVGSLENRGIEFSINAQPVASKDFNWNLNFNIAYNKNKVLTLSKVPDTTSAGIQVGTISGGTGNSIQILSVGYPVNSFYVYKQIYDQNGKPIEGVYSDVNKTSGGNLFYRYKSPDPKLTLGFTSQFQYQKWSLSFVLRADVGNYVYNNVKSGSTYNSVFTSLGFLGNTTNDVLNTNFQNSQYFSDYYIENASFLKMDNLTLGYNFGKIMSKSSNFRVSAIVQNVFTITKYTGLDPEVFNGIDNNIYPRPRIYSLALNLDF